MNQRYKGVLITLISILYLVCPAVADELDDQVREISHQLRCPTCQAMSVKESDAGLSLNMKIKIRELLKEGKSRDEILQFFQERYGEWILRSPQKKGFNLLLWLLPGVIILTAVSMLYISIRRRSNLSEADELVPLTKKEADRIQKDLNKLNQDL